MGKRYWTLIEWHEDTKKWSPQFGDYSKSVVTQEWRDSYKGNGLHYRVICSGDTQAEIEAAIAKEEPML
jgi:hypothetical protein